MTNSGPQNNTQKTKLNIEQEGKPHKEPG